MISLDTTAKLLQVWLEGSASSAECQFFCSFNDERLAADTLNQSLQSSYAGVTTGATPATLVPAPFKGINRKVSTLSIYNADSVDHTVGIRLNDGGTLRTLVKVIVKSGSTLHYTGELSFFTTNLRGGTEGSLVIVDPDTGLGAAVITEEADSGMAGIVVRMAPNRQLSFLEDRLIELIEEVRSLKGILLR